MKEGLEWSYQPEYDLYVLKRIDLGEFGERQEKSVALSPSQALKFAEMVCSRESLRLGNRPLPGEGPL